MTAREKVVVIIIEMYKPIAEAALGLWKINLKLRIQDNKQKVAIASEPNTPKCTNQDKAISLSRWFKVPNDHAKGKILAKNDK